MSDLWFNIRFGEYHFQLGPNNCGFSHNKYHKSARLESNWRWFEVYEFFGVILSSR